MVNTLFNKLPGDKEKYVFYFKKKNWRNSLANLFFKSIKEKVK